MLSKAREEAQKILQDAKDTADQTIRNINKLAKSSGVNKELEAERTKLRGKIQDVDKKLAVKKTAAPKKAVSAKKLRLGDTVRVLSMNLKGTVSSLPNAKGDLYVQMGILRSLVNIRDLEMVEEAPSPDRDFPARIRAVPAAPEAEAARLRCPSPSAYRRRST